MEVFGGGKWQGIVFIRQIIKGIITILNFTKSAGQP